MPVAPDRAAWSLAGQYRLAAEPRPRGGRPGETRGAGVGASVEFQDRRGFLPGDDVRRLDWRALARTDKLLLRQYREEVSPGLELVVDTSRSMAVDADKARRTVDLAALLGEAGRAEGWRVRLVLVEGATIRPAPLERLLKEGVEFEGRGALPEAAPGLAARLGPGRLVVVLSDLLFPASPEAVVAPLAARAGRLALVQVLGVEDAEPPAGSWRLMDAESGAVVERAVDRAEIAAYKTRLERHLAGYRDACRRAGALFVSAHADRPLVELASGELVGAGLLVPRGMARGVGRG